LVSGCGGGAVLMNLWPLALAEQPPAPRQLELVWAELDETP
jgi:hypothetical protein